MLARPMTPEAPDLSVVIPAYNEVENLDPLLAELRAALAQVSGTYEIVLVDDASTDGTAERITAEAARDPRVRAVLLERNSGQSAALAAGFSRVRGKVIVTLDADLQNDPADLPRVLAALDGADVVSGIRMGRQDTWASAARSSASNGSRFSTSLYAGITTDRSGASGVMGRASIADRGRRGQRTRRAGGTH